jgi:transposase
VNAHLLEPYRTQQQLLMLIPGIDHIIAASIIAEIGVDMSGFEDVAHLASWAGICPGLNQSSEKRFSTHIGRGNPFLKAGLVQAAVTGCRKRGSYLKTNSSGSRRGAVFVERRWRWPAKYWLSLITC